MEEPQRRSMPPSPMPGGGGGDGGGGGGGGGGGSVGGGYGYGGAGSARCGVTNRQCSQPNERIQCHGWSIQLDLRFDDQRPFTTGDDEARSNRNLSRPCGCRTRLAQLDETLLSPDHRTAQAPHPTCVL